MGDPTSAQLNLVKAVKELAISPDKSFCIRLHPRQRKLNNFKDSYSINEIPSNIYLSESGDSDLLIQETKIAIGIHSTVLMRALLLNKIVITYDSAWYSQLTEKLLIFQIKDYAINFIDYSSDQM